MEQETENMKRWGKSCARSARLARRSWVARRKIPARGSAGFALLFAILASTVLLSVAVAIWSIALREVVLSSFGRESQIAFYAADTGAECALYWDTRSNAFSTSTLSTSTINCGGSQNFSVGGGGDSSPQSTINNLKLGGGSCVTVTVAKRYSGAVLVTSVNAYGHNTCDQSNPTLVERGLFVTF